VQKVGNLQVIIEALDFASRAHRGNLEALLKDREEAIFTPTEKVEVVVDTDDKRITISEG
jgi:hypothetical protein